MTVTRSALDILREAADLNRADPLLRGCTLHFPDYGQLVMTGDVHGHKRNFDKLRRFCNLEATPIRHVILHELIHREPEGGQEHDDSHLLLLEAAQWKCEHPDQVHFLHSNHELAQLTGQEISKGGRFVVSSFERAVKETYGADGDGVVDAISEFIASFALAGVTRNRIMLSHSLPNRNASSFDPSILSRSIQPVDLEEDGGVYAMVWGRNHPAAHLNALAEQFDVDWFICGHQPQETGFAVVGERMLILASDHNHGAFLPFDLKKSYTMDDLVRLIRPIAAIE